MSVIRTEIIKNHEDGEVHIRVTAEFTIYTPVNSINKIREGFEKEMSKYAI